MKAVKVLIVGGDSGIGAGLAKHYRDIGYDVTTTSRQGTGLHFDLSEINTWGVLNCSMYELVYFCIGISSGTPAHIMNINALYAVNFLEILAKRVEPGGKLVLLTTHISCPSFLNTSKEFCEIANRHLAYSMSRSAFNTGAVIQSKMLDHCKWLLIHPGFVATKATNFNPRAISVSTSVNGIARVVERASMSGSLEFLDYRGQALSF